MMRHFFNQSGRGHPVQLILELQTLQFQALQRFVADRLELLFIAADALVDGIVLFEQAGKMLVVGLQRMECSANSGKFDGQGMG